MSQRRRQSQDFSDSIRSFILDQSKRSNSSTLSKCSDSDNLLNQTIDLTDDEKNAATTSHQSDVSFHTASSQQKWASPQTSIEKDSLENCSQEDVSFKNHVKETIYRRLSHQFQKKPIDFTHKLVSILEESYAQHSFSDEQKHSEVSLDKIADEFIKLCKFIEDESMPDLATTMMTPSPKKCLPNQPDETENLFRGLAAANKMSPRSPGHLSNDTCTFEFWEKVCDDLYQDKELERQVEVPKPALNSTTSSIYTICEQQMASLTDEDTVGPKKNDSATSYYTPNESFLDKPMYDANVMELGIQEEMIKYRQRCMQLAKEMSEIEQEGLQEDSRHNESIKNGYFLETINRCLEYKNALVNKAEKQQRKDNKCKVPTQSKKSEIVTRIPARKTPAKLRTPSTLAGKVGGGPSTSDKSKVVDNKIGVLKQAASGVSSNKKDTVGVGTKPRAKSPARTFFVTPGRCSTVKKIARKKNFFTDPVDTPKEPDNDNKRTPNSIQKLKYQNVVSPLSKYINYKDAHLMQNVQAVTNDMMLTPRKGDPGDKLKIPLSPKTQVSGCENKDPSLPRVYYKRPDEVKVVKQSPKMFPCRGVLESINNRVVIKHMGRVQNQEEGTEMSVLEEKQAF